jgi:ABC-2 type transport system permease protein
LRSQLTYRVSFALDCLGQVFAQATELIAILVLFSRTSSLGGFTSGEVLLIYALASTAFGLADLVVGELDALPNYIRKGTFDVLLLRPLGTLPQMLTSDVELRRLGRAAVGLAVLGYVLSTTEIQWTAAKLLLVTITPVAGAVILGSVWVASTAVSFWLVDGREMSNAVTYGSNLFTSYPLTVFSGWLRRLLAFVVPGAFVAYYPDLALLQRPDPLGGPGWLSWISPAVAVLAVMVASGVWRFAVRHYRGTGS